MENINFMPNRFRIIYFRKKIKQLKLITIILWIICLSLFVYFSYQSAQYKEISKNVSLEQEKSITAGYSASTKKSSTLKTLETFLLSLDGQINVQELNIRDRKAELRIFVHNENEYIEIIKAIENNRSCNILLISPLTDLDNGHKFNISIEVRPWVWVN